MLNKVTLQGRLVADPELRHTQSGTAVATFRLAVDRDFKDPETGQRKADFINCVSWKQAGEFVARNFTKGQMAVVEGKLQTRDYTDQNGNRHYITEVVTNNIYFCGSKQDGAAPAGSSQGGYGSQGYGNAPGYGANASGYGSTSAGFTDLGDVDDGELPF